MARLSTTLRRRPLVAIVADAATAYGRAVMRGAMKYANLQRSWLIHEETRRLATASTHLPKCDGAIAAGVTPEMFEQIRRRSRYAVFCSGSGDPRRHNVVSMNDYAVGGLGAEHLLECRLEYFAFFQRTESRLVMTRHAGFSDTLRAAGKECARFPGSPNADQVQTEEFRREVTTWLKQLPKPVGIMAVDDSAARALSLCCHNAGIRVPEEVAIVGVNNDDLLCHTSWPPLSSVECNFDRVGFLAAELLDRMLRGEKLKQEERCVRVPPASVVGRQSSNVLAVEDPNLAEALQFIREHACDPCGVKDLLREVPVARRWLERQFIEKLGRTPHEEIIAVRMETARRLLRESSIGLTEVATNCGFASVTSFTRAFVTAQGLTPTAYRKKVRVIPHAK